MIPWWLAAYMCTGMLLALVGTIVGPVRESERPGLTAVVATGLVATAWPVILVIAVVRK